MKCIAIMIVLVTLLVAICSTAAFAKIITGNNNNNHLLESPGNDTMNGRGGNDFLDAQLWGGATGVNDSDTLKGGRQSDVLVAIDGDNGDFLIGGRGVHDRCLGDSGDSFAASCEIVSREP
jgi:hypothetical protein